MPSRKILVIAGPNGAGKTTFARAATGRRNFETLYRGAVDDWILYDNSGNEPVAIEWGERS